MLEHDNQDEPFSNPWFAPTGVLHTVLGTIFTEGANSVKPLQKKFSIMILGMWNFNYVERLGMPLEHEDVRQSDGGI